MSNKSMEPFGLALKDYYEGKRDVKIILHRDDGFKQNYLARIHK